MIRAVPEQRTAVVHARRRRQLWCYTAAAAALLLLPTAAVQAVSTDRMLGRLALDVVPPSPKGTASHAVTPDTTITVHGARVSVSNDANRASQRTCVRVTDGTVSVTPRDGPTRVLVSGQSLGCAETSGEKGTAEADPSHESSLRAFEKSSGLGSALPRDEKPARPSAFAADRSLAHENLLLQRALAAEKRGDLAAAYSLLRALLARHPSSPIVDAAQVALQRVMRKRQAHSANRRFRRSPYRNSYKGVRHHA
jgi:hypothetical protein